MKQEDLLPHLFRTEYRKIVSVLCSLFGIAHIAAAEDIVSDTFLAATEQWGMKGIPPNPAAWLYTVAKNKTRNYLQRNDLFAGKISVELRNTADMVDALEPDLSEQNILDSQLAMMFAVCNPVIPTDAQIALALTLLCGFGTQEAADAFMTNKEVIYKRIKRAKEKLKLAGIRIEQPTKTEVKERMNNVLTSLYLLFSEGYYSTSQNRQLRRELCAEAMRLNSLLLQKELTNTPAANALLSLMCFHASRFDARLGTDGQAVLYDEQNEDLWDLELIAQGTWYLNRSSGGSDISKYHLEAGIAYWHTHKQDSLEKWMNILDLYNQLLVLEYSPIAALNRTYALAKVRGKERAIVEAEKLQLTGNPFYHSLLGYLYTGTANDKALLNYREALRLSTSEVDKTTVAQHIAMLEDNLESELLKNTV